MVRKSLYFFFRHVFCSTMKTKTPGPRRGPMEFGDELRKGRSLLGENEDGRTPVAV